MVEGWQGSRVELLINTLANYQIFHFSAALAQLHLIKKMGFFVLSVVEIDFLFHCPQKS